MRLMATCVRLRVRGNRLHVCPPDDDLLTLAFGRGEQARIDRLASIAGGQDPSEAEAASRVRGYFH